MGNNSSGTAISEATQNKVRAYLREGKVKYKGMKRVLMSATKVEDFQEHFLKEAKNALSHILVGLGFVFPESEREAALVVLFSELKKEVLYHW